MKADQPTVEEMNKVIAEFMRYNTIYGEKPFVPFYKPYGMSDMEYAEEISIAENKLAEWDYHNRLQYHTSWDWLMNVVEKIQNIYNTVDLREHKRMRNLELEISMIKIMPATISQVHKAVYEFILWYNQTNSQPITL